VPGGDVLYLRHPRRALAALLALEAAAFCFVTTENLPVGLLGLMADSLHSSVSAVGFLVTAYAAVVVISSAPLTHLTSRLPRRPLVCGLVAVLVLSTLASATAGGYGWLLGTRIVTALAQGLFWSIVAVTAVSLFPPEVRSRAVAGVFAGVPLALVLGVPAGTWLGQLGGWRLPFFVLSGLGAAILAATAVLLPRYHPSETHAAAGSEPNRRRYQLQLLTCVLVVTGAFTAYTYVSAFLTHVARLPAHDVAAVLLVAGLGSALGVAASGALFDEHPALVSVAPEVLLACALLGLYLFGTAPATAVTLEALASFAQGSFSVSNQNRILVVAPGSTDVASAWVSTSFNIGIAGGSLTGALVVPALGLRATTLVGGLLAIGALIVTLSDRLAAQIGAQARAGRARR
jgi:predicted MFS family arabinose efflux permease